MGAGSGPISVFLLVLESCSLLLIGGASRLAALSPLSCRVAKDVLMMPTRMSFFFEAEGRKISPWF